MYLLESGEEELKIMDQCTHEVRAEYGKGIIKSCSKRPAGQSVRVGWKKMVSVSKVAIAGRRKIAWGCKTKWIGYLGYRFQRIKKLSNSFGETNCMKLSFIVNKFIFCPHVI